MFSLCLSASHSGYSPLVPKGQGFIFPYVWITSCSISCPSVSGHLGWLHGVGVMNSAAVNIEMQGSLTQWFHLLRVHHTQWGNYKLYCSSVFKVLRNFQTVSKTLTLTYPYVTLSPHPCEHLLLFVLLVTAILQQWGDISDSKLLTSSWGSQCWTPRASPGVASNVSVQLALGLAP